MKFAPKLKIFESPEPAPAPPAPVRPVEELLNEALAERLTLEGRLATTEAAISNKEAEFRAAAPAVVAGDVNAIKQQRRTHGEISDLTTESESIRAVLGPLSERIAALEEQRRAELHRERVAAALDEVARIEESTVAALKDFFEAAGRLSDAMTRVDRGLTTLRIPNDEFILDARTRRGSIPAIGSAASETLEAFINAHPDGWTLMQRASALLRRGAIA